HIWDYDVLIWLMSKLNEAIDRGEEVSPRIVATPSEILTGIGRSNVGGDCADLVAALNRLVGTMVETNIGVINYRGRKARRVSTFTHLAGWSHEYEPGTQRRTGIILQLNDWMYQGIVEHRDVLKIPREYFDLTSGYARWLYR